jgi:hypothetical protein
MIMGSVKVRNEAFFVKLGFSASRTLVVSEFVVQKAPEVETPIAYPPEVQERLNLELLD